MKLSNMAVLVTGFAIGIVTGLLVAPEKGSDTRKKMIQKGEKYKRELKNRAEKLKEKATDLKDDIVGAAHDVRERFS